ncbi:protein HEG isoform X2 [Lampris incognitus]|uniref:protein HEG isoform X2 n=1 Tax=Lampris incognitus TaxID=2546036 RepID=UPI0024B618F9|nr:protein HEG isoform X2 [Lampris incognitus]
MERCLANPVLLLVLVALPPSPLQAWTSGPANGDRTPGTPGDASTVRGELSRPTAPQQVLTSDPGTPESPAAGRVPTGRAEPTSAGATTSASSTASSTSSTAAAADTATEQTQTQTLTETSSWSFERTTERSTEVYTVLATTESSGTAWEDLSIPDQLLNVSSALSLEPRPWTVMEEARLAQDNTESGLRPEDVTSLSSGTSRGVAINTDSTYISTTINRAGERTLLSVTSSNNSTSSVFTEDSNSRQPPSTGLSSVRGTESEDYTDSALSTRTNDGDTTHLDHHLTSSFRGTFSETESPESSKSTYFWMEERNTTQHHLTSISEETPNSTPPLRVIGKDESSPSTDQLEVSVSSTLPVISSEGSTANISWTEQGHTSGSSTGTFTESSSGVQTSSSQNQGLTEKVSSQTREESLGTGLTKVPPTISTSVTALDESLARFLSDQPPFIPQTERPVLATEIFLTTTPVTVTHSSQVTEEEETHTASTTTSTTATSSQGTALLPQSSSSGSPTTEAPTQPTTQRTTPSTTTFTLAQQTSTAATPQPPPLPPSQTQGPTTGAADPTNVTTLKVETSTATSRNTATNSRPTTTSYSSTTRSTEAPHTIGKQTDRGTTASIVTTAPMEVQSTKALSAKTFLGTFTVTRQPRDPVLYQGASMHEIQREIIQLLNVSLLILRGYRRSTLSKKEGDGALITAVNTFYISTNVTSAEVFNSIQMSLSNCSTAAAHCRVLLHHRLSYHVESLCVAQKTQCDTERSTCTDSGGTAYCQCLPGYYKHNPDDLSCIECGDGYKLENGTCVQCMFGFGGFNCGNFYKLIAVVVSPAGGALLLILFIALIVTCCRKDKNDINKIIFKSGDLQMSPYADFPKSNRVSMEWGRETIEMQENGSTKNLLQMTDIYYSPALRNSDLERNGLYPFTGLPGSRHSCIYPAQWNPSFISDDSRRRDYF